MAKRIPLYPRRDYAKKLAKEFLIKSKVKALPINPFAICKQHGFVIRSVKETEDIIHEIDPFDVRENPDCDAKTYLTSKGRYVIVYDDAVFSQGRIIWTIAHEIGHIVLKHLTQFEQTEIHKGLTDKENEVLEKEADAFASEFLAPAEVLLSCKCVKKKMIIKLCGLSDEAAFYRKEYLKNYQPDYKYERLDKEIYKQFFNFIHNKDFFVNLHYKICPVCKNYLLSTKERFCRICGNQVTSRTLMKGIIYNDGPEMGKQKRTFVCPKCLRHRGSKSGSNCSHCGTSLINRCSNPSCKKTHIGSSRYCYECGKPNSFLLNGIVPDWKVSQKNLEEQKNAKHALEQDKETGRIFDEWNYLLNFIKKEGEFFIYNALKNSIAKIDYDTLSIYSGSDDVRKWIKDERFTIYIMKLLKEKLGVEVLEVLSLKLNPHGKICLET